MVSMIGMPKGMTREEVLSRTTGLKDVNGNVVNWITLTRLQGRDVAEGTRTHGFDSTIISMGQNGFSITHKEGSYVTWHKDIVTGMGYTVLAATKNNLEVLASTYFDKTFTIREHTFEEKVKEMAEAKEEELKKQFVHLKDSYGEPLYNPDGKPKLKCMADIVKEKRAGSRKSIYGYIEIPDAPIQNSNELGDALAENAKLLADVRRENERLKKDLMAANISRQGAVSTGVIANSDYTREYFESINPFTALKKRAKEEFGIEDAEHSTKSAIIDAIMDKLSVAPPVTIE